VTIVLLKETSFPLWRVWTTIGTGMLFSGLLLLLINIIIIIFNTLSCKDPEG